MAILFSFVDPKDPYALAEIDAEEQPGPILSLLAARPFDTLHLFHTSHVRTNTEAVRAEVARLYPACRVMTHELPAADPKDYSALMGPLARAVRGIVATSRGAEQFVCVSSGTAEMRAAWFLLVASGALPATLLQIGSPAFPLFGAANVKEVHLDTGDWNSLRNLVMPSQYFSLPEPTRPVLPAAESPTILSRLRVEKAVATTEPEAAPFPELDAALQELGIFIGSAALRLAAERVAIAASCDMPVLLLGETGTGKELFARLVHRLSQRRHGPMVTINCAAIPRELVESHLFGHVKGAFTSATTDQKGKFEHASGGTLFLDEIGELPLEAQAKLLRVLEDGCIEPLGSNHTRQTDVRIVAATNRNLPAEVAGGRFREDLYYRLEVVQVRLPPLRERTGEIASLAVALLKLINHRLRRQRRLSKRALERLEQHTWPGNVRELSNVLERSILYSRSDVLEQDDLLIVEKPRPGDPLTALPEPEHGFSLDQFLDAVRKQLILRALEKAAGNQSAAADLLGLSKQAVNKFLKGQN